ncbi:L,D-transpeptidase family protein [Cryomorphaceae bacterium 1068]|nr:L,D-transpeptidase family protein [Cryomorphaceae bacterium 1068]
MKKRVIFLFIAAVAIVVFANFGRSVWVPVYIKVKGKETIKSIEEKIETDSLERLWSSLRAAGFSELPNEMALVAIKEDQVLEIWGKQSSKWVLIKTYPFTAFSGKPGPKLKEGDKQIPEGIYKIEYLNPNSLFYLSMKVSYPNDFDRAKAATDGRTNLGGDIFIHGKDKTIGCIPIGDEPIEEVFLLASKTLKNEIKVVISPVDFRKAEPYPNIESVSWSDELYESIELELKTSFSN